MTEIRVERVEVPVKILCVAHKDIPVRPSMVPVDINVADTRQLAAAMSAYAQELHAYANRAEVVMTQCAGAVK